MMRVLFCLKYANQNNSCMFHNCNNMLEVKGCLNNCFLENKIYQLILFKMLIQKTNSQSTS